MRLIALLFAVLPAIAAAESYVDLSITLEPGDPALVSTATTPLTYRWRSGCVASRQYERPLVVTTAKPYRMTGLPDSGRCYFEVTIVDAMAKTFTEPEEGIYDLGALRQIPSTPPVGPVVTWAPAPPVATTVTLTRLNVSDEYSLAITGAQPVRIAATGGAVFDWVRVGSAFVVTVPPTGGSNDNVTATTVTLQAPISNATVDFDGSAQFRGANVTVAGTTKPLVQSSSTWRVSFP